MDSFVKLITDVNGAINGFVWGPIMLLLLVGTGVYITFRTGFFQIVNFGDVWKNTLGKVFNKAERGKKDEVGISPWAAMTTALAATVGTGNIVGVATAIVSGGPGAVFWMWVSAFFGMMTKYSEVVLAVKYRTMNASGEWSGGPMYYIKNGLGQKWNWMATLFAVLAMLASFGIGNLTQVNSIATAMNNSFGVPLIVSGAIVAALCALVIIGGITRIGSTTEKLVPFMSLLYIIGALILLIVNAKNIPVAFGAIFKNAFSFKSAAGGAIGYTVMMAMRYGVARGVFSNEAGLGSAPIAHAATQEKDPVMQGMYGVFEVFVDTIVICTLTALSVLTSGVFDLTLTGDALMQNITGAGLKGVALTSAAFGTGFGKIGGMFIAVAILLFALSTIISWSYYGAKCTEYLWGEKAILVYRIIFIACIVIGAFTELTLAWDIADTLNGLMAIPNLIAILGLSPVVFALTKEYIKSKNSLR